MSEIIMYGGFAMAAYSVIGNDVIQTLGTFLSSNEKRPWYVLWAFAGSILAATLIYGWYVNGGDVSYGRLIGDNGTFSDPKYPFVSPMPWYYILPPLTLLIITRIGIPVSTSFLILTFFLPKGLWSMSMKSFIGYGVAFGVGIFFYLLTAKFLETRFVEKELNQKENKYKMWLTLQWCSTAFLWSQWLIQDFANIYVYLPRQIDGMTLIFTLIGMLALLAYIFWQKGGAIQGIVKAKTNTEDIRSATFIDLLFGILLYFFKELNKIPMSTTWVFLGLLAGREFALQLVMGAKNAAQLDDQILDADGDLHRKVYNKTFMEILKMVLMDLGKAFLGLAISVLLVYLIRWIA